MDGSSAFLEYLGHCDGRSTCTKIGEIAQNIRNKRRYNPNSSLKLLLLSRESVSEPSRASARTRQLCLIRSTVYGVLVDTSHSGVCLVFRRPRRLCRGPNFQRRTDVRFGHRATVGHHACTNIAATVTSLNRLPLERRSFLVIEPTVWSPQRAPTLLRPSRH